MENETMKYVELFNKIIIIIWNKWKCLYSDDELTYEAIKYVKCLDMKNMETLT